MMCYDYTGQSAAKAAVKNLVIYTITNIVTGKKYVGQSRQGLARRKGEHIHRFKLGERDHKLYQSMRKHGIDKFRFEILCHALKAEHLNDLEAHFIREFNSFRRGYNMTCGGDGVSDETRAKLSAAHKGRVITWAHKTVATRRRNGSYHRPGVKGAAHWRATEYLVRMPTGEERKIKGLRQFCRDHDLKHSTMLAVLAGKQHHHKGYTLLARFND